MDVHQKTFAAHRNHVDSGGWQFAGSLYRYIWRTSRSSQIAICLLSAIIAPLSMVNLELQRRIIDDAINARNIHLLVALGAGYIAIICMRVALKYLIDIFKGMGVEAVARDLRLRIMKGVQAIWPRGTRASTTIAMLGVETEDLSGFAGDALSLPLLSGGTAIWVIGYLMWIQPLIAAFALILYLPQLLIVPVTQFTLNRLARMRIRQVRSLGYLAMHESRKSEEVLTVPGKVLIDRLYRIRIWIYLRKFLITELGNFLDSLGPIIVFALGGYLVIRGETEVSTLLVFISGLQKIADPWDQIVTFYRNVSNTGVMYDMIRRKLSGTPGELLANPLSA